MRRTLSSTSVLVIVLAAIAVAGPQAGGAAPATCHGLTATIVGSPVNDTITGTLNAAAIASSASVTFTPGPATTLVVTGPASITAGVARPARVPRRGAGTAGCRFVKPRTCIS